MMSKLSQIGSGIVAAGQIAKQVTAVPGRLAGGAVGGVIGFGRGCVQIAGSKILNKLQKKWHFEPKSLTEYIVSDAKTGARLGGLASNVATIVAAPHLLGPAGYAISGLVYIGMLADVRAELHANLNQPRYTPSPYQYESSSENSQVKRMQLGQSNTRFRSEHSVNESVTPEPLSPTPNNENTPEYFAAMEKKDQL